MLKKFSFWARTAAVLQVLTGLVHAMSFLVKRQPDNDTDRQLLELMALPQDMGAGFHPTMMQIFLALSACFTLLYLFSGVSNFYLLRKNVGPEVWKGLLSIQVFFFGVAFGIMATMTFLPPIVLTGLVFVALLLARVTVSRAS